MNPAYLKLAGRLHAEVGLLDKAEHYYNEAIVWGGEDPVVVQGAGRVAQGHQEGLGRSIRKGHLMLKARACGLSDVGVLRSHNEDCFEIDPEHQMYVVADGMGGHSHGEIASRIAVQAIREYVANAGAVRRAGRPPLVRLPVGAPHRAPQAGDPAGPRPRAEGDPPGRLAPRHGHDGGRAAARRRQGQPSRTSATAAPTACATARLELLTQDHTWVNEQVVAGFLSEEQARVHPLKNVVTRALGWRLRGGRRRPRLADRARRPLPALLGRPDHDALGRRDPRAPRAAASRLEEACGRLVRDANARGGFDNISVVLLRVEEDVDTDEETAHSETASAFRLRRGGHAPSPSITPRSDIPCAP